MTNEQAITVLNMIEAHGDLAIKAKELAIEALKKQILQKVKNQFISHNGVITCFEEFVCPVCGYRISDGDGTVEEYYDFCPGCGQALDWSDDE